MSKDTPRLGHWVVRQSARGHLYRVWRRGRVPRIPQEYLDCSIYLYDSREAAEAGENFGGSGCLVELRSDAPFDREFFERTRRALIYPPHIYAVTNRHVVEAGFPVIRLNTIDDKIDVLELEQDDWMPHPEGDDLIVAAIDLPPRKHKYHPIHSDDFLLRYQVTDVGAGDDTFMVGRFVSHAGVQRNTPSLRFGSIAMLPFEKVRLEGGHMQESYLIETRSISGYSGSPVFVYRPTQKTTAFKIPNVRPTWEDPYAEKYQKIETTSITDLVGSPALLGIDCGHVLNYGKVLDAGGKPLEYGLKMELNTGMAIVIPAWRLHDHLHTEELVMQRKEKDARYKEEKEAEAQQSSVAFDVQKKQKDITEEDYMDSLKRASRKISSQPESESDET